MTVLAIISSIFKNILMNGKYMTIRKNSKGILYTDETEYIKAFEKSWEVETKRITEHVKRKRGRPRKNVKQSITIKKGDYLITFD